MNSRFTDSGTLGQLLHGEQVRRAEVEGRTWYAGVDAVAFLSEAPLSQELWTELKAREPRIAQLVRHVEFAAISGRPDTSEGLDLESLFRLVQSLDSPRAERLKDWLARSGRRRILEAQNPELLAVRARKLYEQRGYPRRWVDKRLRGISARHELTAEWYKRGVSDSEQFRGLTNRLMHSAFGMDVEAYRRYKNLTGLNQHLRDHMSDLELALTSLGETAAVALHQAHDSQGPQQLELDAKDAGEIVAQTRAEIERRSGRNVLQRGGFSDRPRNGAPEVASEPKDKDNILPSRAVA